MLRRNNTILTPENARELQETAFQKNSPKFKKSCENLDKKIYRYIKKLIKDGYKDPYKIYGSCKRKSLTQQDTLRILTESLKSIEDKWYIAISLEKIGAFTPTFHLSNFITPPDQLFIIIVSERPITGNYHYISNKTVDRCECDDDENCKRCSLCDDNHVTCAVYPCGHANYCWDCVDKIKKCGICRRDIFEVKHVFT